MHAQSKVATATQQQPVVAVQEGRFSVVNYFFKASRIIKFYVKSIDFIYLFITDKFLLCHPGCTAVA